MYQQLNASEIKRKKENHWMCVSCLQFKLRLQVPDSLWPFLGLLAKLNINDLLGKLISSLDFHSSSEGKKETVLMLLWSDVFSFPIPFPSPSFFFLNPKWVNIDFRQLMAKEAVPAMDAAHKYSKRHALPVEPPYRPLAPVPLPPPLP